MKTTSDSAVPQKKKKRKENNTKNPKQASLTLEGEYIPYRNMFSILLDRYNQILMTMEKLL